MAKFCMKCGNKLEEGSKFCMSCGAPVENDAPNKPKRRQAPAKVIPVEMDNQSGAIEDSMELHDETTKRPQTSTKSTLTGQAQPTKASARASQAVSSERVPNKTTSSEKALARPSKSSKASKPAASKAPKKKTGKRALSLVLAASLFFTAFVKPGFIKPLFGDGGSNPPDYLYNFPTKPASGAGNGQSGSGQSGIPGQNGQNGQNGQTAQLDEEAILEQSIKEDHRAEKAIQLLLTLDPDEVWSPDFEIYSDIKAAYTDADRAKGVKEQCAVSSENHVVSLCDITVDMDDLNLNGEDQLEVVKLPDLENPETGSVLKGYDLNLASGQHEFRFDVKIDIPIDPTAGHINDALSYNEEKQKWESIYYECSPDGKTCSIYTNHFSDKALEYVPGEDFSDDKEVAKIRKQYLDQILTLKGTAPAYLAACFVEVPKSRNSNRMVSLVRFNRKLFESGNFDPAPFDAKQWSDDIERLYKAAKRSREETNVSDSDFALMVANDIYGGLNASNGLLYGVDEHRINAGKSLLTSPETHAMQGKLGNWFAVADILICAGKVCEGVVNERDWQEIFWDNTGNRLTFLGGALSALGLATAGVATGSALALGAPVAGTCGFFIFLTSLTNDIHTYQKTVTNGSYLMRNAMDDYYKRDDVIVKASQILPKKLMAKLDGGKSKAKAYSKALKSYEFPISEMLEGGSTWLSLVADFFEACKDFDAENTSKHMETFFNNASNRFFALKASERAAYITNWTLKDNGCKKVADLPKVTRADLDIQADSETDMDAKELKAYHKPYLTVLKGEILNAAYPTLKKCFTQAIREFRQNFITRSNLIVEPAMNTNMYFNVLDTSLSENTSFSKSLYAVDFYKIAINKIFNVGSGNNFDKAECPMRFEDAAAGPLFLPAWRDPVDGYKVKAGKAEYYYPLTDNFLPNYKKTGKNQAEVFTCNLYHYLLMGGPSKMHFTNPRTSEDNGVVNFGKNLEYDQHGDIIFTIPVKPPVEETTTTAASSERRHVTASYDIDHFEFGVFQRARGKTIRIEDDKIILPNFDYHEDGNICKEYGPFNGKKWYETDVKCTIGSGLIGEKIPFTVTTHETLRGGESLFLDDEKNYGRTFRNTELITTTILKGTIETTYKQKSIEFHFTFEETATSLYSWYDNDGNYYKIDEMKETKKSEDTGYTLVAALGLAEKYWK